MCGIAGVVFDDNALRARDAVERMCTYMAARGPDDEGVVALESGAQGVVLGARRLAIIDLSPAGHQPMRDFERGTTIVFNGMIYNFRELRRELESHGERFHSDCDTEVVLRAYGWWGREAVKRLQGMFAFAIWDERKRELILARDRLGIKPLYYRQDGPFLAFASQVKALVKAQLAEKRLSEAGIRSFLAFGAVSEPFTALDGIVPLPPAHVATLKESTIHCERYWSTGQAPEPTSKTEAVEALSALVETAVARHLVSDAPLGVFLSGGLDSSIVSAAAARHVSQVRSFSVVFDDASLSEERYSRLLAKHIASEHTSVELGVDDLRSWLPSAFDSMDQPSFDGVNTYFVSRAAAESGLKVALSGLGADELFDGYGYARRAAHLESLKRLPMPLTHVVRGGSKLALSGPQAAKLGAWLTPAYGRGSSYELLRSLFLREELDWLSRAKGDFGPGPSTSTTYRHGVPASLVALELDGYLKNVLLRDTDAMSMGNSLEVRVPFLDDELVEWALRLPPELAALKGKRLLAEASIHLVPTEILQRRKHGFVLPLDSWIRAELAEDVRGVLHTLPPDVAEVIDAAAAADVWRGYTEDRSGWLRPWALYSLGKWTESLS